MFPPAGVVLTGGRSRRFGSPKALALVEGVPMAIRVARALHAGGCDPVIAQGSLPGLEALIADDPGPEPGFTSSAVLLDETPGEGPLAAVVSALGALERDLVTTACDLPWLRPNAVAAVIAAAEEGRSRGVEVVHAAARGQMVPVIWWSSMALDGLRSAQRAGERSLKGAIARVMSTAVEIDPEAGRGVNRPADLSG